MPESIPQRQERERMRNGKEKTPTCFQIGVSYLKLDDDLRSPVEACPVLRGCIVSLLSSGWGQLVPMLYGRQAMRLLRGCCVRTAKRGKSDNAVTGISCISRLSPVL